MGRRATIATWTALLVLGALLAPAGAQTSPPGSQDLGSVRGIAVSRTAGAGRVGTAIAVSRLVHETATAAVLARADDFADALVGAPLAAHLGGPILLTDRSRLSAGVAEEVRRLGASEVVLLGGEAALSRQIAGAFGPEVRVTRVAGSDRYGTAAAVARRLPRTDAVFVATGADFPDALAVGPFAAHTRRPVLLTTRDRIPPATAEVLDERRPSEAVVLGGRAAVGDAVTAALADRGSTVRRLAGPTRYHTALAIHDESVRAGLSASRLWVATGRSFPDALSAGPAAGHLGVPLLLVDGRDLCNVPPAIERLRRGDVRELRLIGGRGAISGDAPAHLEEAADPARTCLRLPRGGRAPFPAFRMVAFYGNGETPLLGVLGEGTPDQAAQRLEAQAAPYAAAGRPVLPVFEYIATVAQRAPGPDGMYRSLSDPAVLRRYLEAARRHRMYLVLDIQPGQSDFLTEVRRWEELLREPDVGIALDPEWRMPPGRRPGDGVGHVDAAEINAVSAYVADLVRTHDLPDKVFIVHQFQDQMVRDKSQVVDRQGLAIVWHADGFGTRPQKVGTYRRTILGSPFFTGFKLFYDEDTQVYSPAELIAEVDPIPDFISYQ